MHPGSFDRAASTYDETRAFPPGIAVEVSQAAIALLPRGAASTVLEVGVGTGRIARPLLAGEVKVVGLDVSRNMMDRLLATLPSGVGRPALVQAAAEALPFAAGVFDAAVSVHVFHLLVDWRIALAEVRRALRPGGVFLAGFEQRAPDSPGPRLMQHWRQIVQARGVEPDGPGLTDFADIKAALLASGAHCVERSVGAWSVRRTLARQIDSIEHRTWSAGARMPAGFFEVCLRDLRQWAVQEFGALDREFEIPEHFVWQRFTWPGTGL
jgi:SAM-dependent methyltransferase